MCWLTFQDTQAAIAWTCCPTVPAPSISPWWGTLIALGLTMYFTYLTRNAIHSLLQTSSDSTDPSSVSNQAAICFQSPPKNTLLRPPALAQ